MPLSSLRLGNAVWTSPPPTDGRGLPPTAITEAEWQGAVRKQRDMAPAAFVLLPQARARCLALLPACLSSS